MVDAIILAGGLGTRLREAVPHLPKPLAPIHGVAFLDLLLDQIEQAGIVDKIILALGYQSEAIVQHYREKKRSIPIEYSIEETPLGTGGATQKALEKADSSLVFVFNGDSYLSCHLRTMLAHYCDSFVMAYTHVTDASRYGKIEIDEKNRVIAFQEKQYATEPGFVNAGIYLFDRKIYDRPLPKSFSLEKDLLPSLLQEGIYGFYCDGLFIDIGTKESYGLAQQRLQSLTRQNGKND